jgi:26S proteasome regulatory subunit N5
VARLSNDNTESIRILSSIAKICYDLRNFKDLNDVALQLCKKRGQPKKAQIEMVK